MKRGFTLSKAKPPKSKKTKPAVKKSKKRKKDGTKGSDKEESVVMSIWVPRSLRDRLTDAARREKCSRNRKVLLLLTKAMKHE